MKTFTIGMVLVGLVMGAGAALADATVKRWQKEQAAVFGADSILFTTQRKDYETVSQRADAGIRCVSGNHTLYIATRPKDKAKAFRLEIRVDGVLCGEPSVSRDIEYTTISCPEIYKQGVKHQIEAKLFVNKNSTAGWRTNPDTGRRERFYANANGKQVAAATFDCTNE